MHSIADARAQSAAHSRVIALSISLYIYIDNNYIDAAANRSRRALSTHQPALRQTLGLAGIILIGELVEYFSMVIYMVVYSAKGDSWICNTATHAHIPPALSSFRKYSIGLLFDLRASADALCARILFVPNANYMSAIVCCAHALVLYLSNTVWRQSRLMAIDGRMVGWLQPNYSWWRGKMCNRDWRSAVVSTDIERWLSARSIEVLIYLIVLSKLIQVQQYCNRIYFLVMDSVDRCMCFV